jgi:protein involved in polysaccharide export with SLBB domain
MRVSLAIGLAGLLVLLLGCTGSAPTLDSTPTAALSAAPSASTTGAPDLSTNDYKLGSGDRIRVLVFGERDLSGEFEVGAAGTIDMPLIGAVPAMGVTVGQFQSDVTNRLRNGYLNDPKVSVQVLNYRPYFITGEVQKTGEFPYKAGLTVQDAIGVAGGYTYRANTGRVYIRRAGAAQEVAVDLTQRINVNPGDSIRVPERFF